MIILLVLTALVAGGLSGLFLSDAHVSLHTASNRAIPAKLRYREFIEARAHLARTAVTLVVFFTLIVLGWLVP